MPGLPYWNCGRSLRPWTEGCRYLPIWPFCVRANVWLWTFLCWLFLFLFGIFEFPPRLLNQPEMKRMLKIQLKVYFPWNDFRENELRRANFCTNNSKEWKQEQNYLLWKTLCKVNRYVSANCVMCYQKISITIFLLFKAKRFLIFSNASLLGPFANHRNLIKRHLLAKTLRWFIHLLGLRFLMKKGYVLHNFCCIKVVCQCHCILCHSHFMVNGKIKMSHTCTI